MLMVEIWVNSGPPKNIWTPQNFTIANFGHPVSKTWLRPWMVPEPVPLNSIQP